MSKTEVSPLVIRTAVIDDTATILRFVRDLAIYENAEHEVQTTEEHVHRTIFSPGATAHALICESEGVPVGMAVYFFNYSTWQGRNGIYTYTLNLTFAAPPAVPVPTASTLALALMGLLLTAAVAWRVHGRARG